MGTAPYIIYWLFVFFRYVRDIPNVEIKRGEFEFSASLGGKKNQVKLDKFQSYFKTKILIKLTAEMMTMNKEMIKKRKK